MILPQYYTVVLLDVLVPVHFTTHNKYCLAKARKDRLKLPYTLNICTEVYHLFTIHDNDIF